MERLLRRPRAGSNAIPSFAYATMWASFLVASWSPPYSIVHAYDPPPVPCDEAAPTTPRPVSSGDEEQRPMQSHWMFGASKRDGVFLKSPDDRLFLQAKGLLQLEYRSFPGGQEKGSPRIVGPGFFVQRARPMFAACVDRQVKIQFTPDFGNGLETPPQLFIANVEWDRFSHARLAYGLMKVPASLEVVQSLQNAPFMERSLVRNLSPLTAIGGTVSGQVWGGRLDYQIGVWNDTPSGNLFVSGEVFSTPSTLTARVFARPFHRHGSAWLGDLGLGLGVTQGWIFDRAGQFPMQTETFSLTFFQFNPNVTGGGPRTRLFPQLSWYWKRVGFLTEYVRKHSREQIMNGPSARFTSEAWSVQGSLFLTDDTASFNEVHPRRPFTRMQAGYWGAWQVAVRYAEIRLDPDTFSLGFTDPSNNARQAKSTTIGLNWYLDSSLRLSVNYAHTDLTGAIPSYIGVRRENGLMFRVQMTY